MIPKTFVYLVCFYGKLSLLANLGYKSKEFTSRCLLAVACSLCLQSSLRTSVEQTYSVFAVLRQFKVLGMIGKNSGLKFSMSHDESKSVEHSFEKGSTVYIFMLRV